MAAHDAAAASTSPSQRRMTWPPLGSRAAAAAHPLTQARARWTQQGACWPGPQCWPAASRSCRQLCGPAALSHDPQKHRTHSAPHRQLRWPSCLLKWMPGPGLLEPPRWRRQSLEHAPSCQPPAMHHTAGPARGGRAQARLKRRYESAQSEANAPVLVLYSTSTTM